MARLVARGLWSQLRRLRPLGLGARRADVGGAHWLQLPAAAAGVAPAARATQASAAAGGTTPPRLSYTPPCARFDAAEGLAVDDDTWHHYKASVELLPDATSAEFEAISRDVLTYAVFPAGVWVAHDTTPGVAFPICLQDF